MRKISLILAFLLSVVSVAMAQRAVSGAVTDDKGQPLMQATVLEKGTTNGTTTDLDGRYALTVTNGATLQFSYVGFTVQEIAVTGASNVFNVSLSESAALNEVVVTALGIKRDARQQGYQAQGVSSETLNKANSTNIVNALSGQVAGLNVISSSGAAGGSSYFTIRGQNSLTGNNQPLIVVDGIILNNDEDGTNSESGTAGVAHSNRGIDLNSSDIESVNVLKGGAAAALYGIRAANGVILLTTKKGGGKKGKAKGLTVDFSTTVTAEQITNIPALQNKFAQGTGGAYAGPWQKQGSSYGPAIDSLVWSGSPSIKTGLGAAGQPGTILYEDSRGTIVGKSTNPSGTKVLPVDNINNFFRTGISYNNSIAVSGGDENTSFRVSASNLTQNGVVPNNTFARTTIGLNGSARLSDKCVATASANYVNSGGNRIQQGSNTSGVMLGLLRTTPTFDNSNGATDPTDPKAYLFADGSPRAYRPTRYDSPFWVINKDKFKDNVNRLYGNVQIEYKLLPWLSVTGRSGMDTYSDRRKATFAIASSTVKPGRAIQDEYEYTHTDNYLFLNGDRKITKDLDFNFIVGGNYYSQSKHNTYVQGDAFSFDGFDHLSNATSTLANETTTGKRTGAVYTSLDFAFKNMLYLTLTGRNEWSSTLPSANNAFFYPSASLGFVFADGNDGLVKTNNIISFGKLRGSWARLGNDADPQSLSSYYTRWQVGDGYVSPVLQWPHNGLNAYGYNTVLGNSGLKPETTTSTEFGADLRFFKGARVGIDAAIYHRLSEDLILPADISPSTGALQAYLNTGKLETNGFDIALTVVPVKTKNFAWNIGVNFNQNRTIVKELAPGLKQLQFLSGFGAGTAHIPGLQYGQIYGTAFLRNDKGQLVIDDDTTSDTYGQPLIDQSGSPVIGNPNPNYTVGINNGFNFGGLSLNFLIDIRNGSQMWNGTRGALVNFGMAKETADHRGEDYTYAGVKASTVTYDANGKAMGGSANDVKVKLDQDLYQQNLSGFTVNEPYVENSGWVRLRTVQLGYAIPAKLLEKTPFGKLSLTFIGRNLIIMTPYTGVDPETNLTGASLIQGLDYFNMPGTRSFALSLNATF